MSKIMKVIRRVWPVREKAKTDKPWAIHEFEHGPGKLFVGKSGHIYTRVNGPVYGYAPMLPKDCKRPLGIIEGYWKDCVPDKQALRSLWSRIFLPHTFEVVVLMGMRADRSFVYIVPNQQGSMGFVRWDDPQAIDLMDKLGASWLGTIHSHPGSSATPSSTDLEDWGKAEKGGIHIILGRTGEYTVSAALEGRIDTVEAGTLDVGIGFYQNPVIHYSPRFRMFEAYVPPALPTLVPPTQYTLAKSRYDEGAWSKNGEFMFEGDNPSPEKDTSFGAGLQDYGTKIPRIGDPDIDPLDFGLLVTPDAVLFRVRDFRKGTGTMDLIIPEDDYWMCVAEDHTLLDYEVETVVDSGKVCYFSEHADKDSIEIGGSE